MNPPTVEYLRQLIADSEWDGRGMLVSQDAWREYLTWALDELEHYQAASVALMLREEKAKSPRPKARARKKSVVSGERQAPAP